MSAPIDCPICMDCIESSTKNCVVTECGHCFHTNCLMTSVAHNGFGCPYCRTAMAEEPEEEDEDEEEEYEEDEIFDDDALRGFRFFWNLLNGEEHDEDDDADEEQLEEWAERAANNQRETDANIPTTDFVAQKLREQGITFEKIIDMICKLDHNEYEENAEQAEEFDNELFGKIRIIVSNYTPAQSQPAQEPEAPVPVSTPEPKQALDFAAQPKIPRFNIHV